MGGWVGGCVLFCSVLFCIERYCGVGGVSESSRVDEVYDR